MGGLQETPAHPAPRAEKEGLSLPTPHRLSLLVCTEFTNSKVP